MLFENLLQSHVKDKFSFAIVCDIYERQDVIAKSWPRKNIRFSSLLEGVRMLVCILTKTKTVYFFWVKLYKLRSIIKINLLCFMVLLLIQLMHDEWLFFLLMSGYWLLFLANKDWESSYTLQISPIYHCMVHQDWQLSLDYDGTWWTIMNFNDAHNVTSCHTQCNIMHGFKDDITLGQWTMLAAWPILYNCSTASHKHNGQETQAGGAKC